MNEARHHPVLSREEWQARMAQHLASAQTWTLPTLKRRAHQVVHPVEDFLFTYYPFKLGKLEQWHPGYGVSLACTADERPAWMQKGYRWENGQLFVDPNEAEEKEKARLFWILDLLQRTAQQPGHFGCFGLHEWAMVYRSEEVRHGKVAKLRLPMTEIEKLVESRPLRCSHYDAFRFFTPEARPLNQLQPTLEGRAEQEQPGCIHANMDLYKWAFKCQHWIPGELLLDAFRLAKDLRHLDMRASPYELSAYGLTPVCIETIEGRRQYEEEQRQLAERASALRQRLIDALEKVCATFTNKVMPTGALVRGQS
jgi:hypothetical protein